MAVAPRPSTEHDAAEYIEQKIFRVVEAQRALGIDAEITLMRDTTLMMKTRSGTHRGAARPRLAILGVGWIGLNRIQSLIDADIVDIACVCDADVAALDHAIRDFPGAVACANVREALEIEAVDGVVIATPNALHAEQSIAFLNRGIAVFCQKPLARTAWEIQRVIDAARQANRLLSVDFSYRYTAGAQAIRNLIECGELGTIHSVDLFFHNAFGPGKPWFFDRSLSGGGCLIDLGIHLIDLAMWLTDCDTFDHVISHLFSGGKPCDRSEIEDFANATFDLADGTCVRLACSWNAPVGCNAWIGIDIYGSKGGASLRNVNGSFYDFVAHHAVGTQRRLIVEPPDNWPGRAVVAWARQLANQMAHQQLSFDGSIERAASVAQTIDRIYGVTL